MKKIISPIFQINSEIFRTPKTLSKIFFAAIAIIIFLIVALFNLANLNQTLISNLSNLVIALYTAFITIFFTVLAIHVSAQYGLSAIDVLWKKSSGILAVYSIAVLSYVLGLIFSKTGLPLSFQINTRWFIIATSASSLVLGMEMAITVLSAYFFPKYLQEALQISPSEIMKEIGYPDGIGKLYKKGKLSARNEPIGRGLLLFRVCIIDLAMRDELEEVASLLSDATKSIPWQEKIEVDGYYRKQGKQMVFFSFHNKIEECVFDPLVNTELKPPVRILSPFFCRLTKIYIDAGLINSSLFIEYLNGLSRVTEAYVNIGKKEALNDFWNISVLWVFKENSNLVSYQEVSSVLSKGLALSASLIRKMETSSDKKYDIMYIQFVSSTIVERWLKEYPRAFTQIEIDDLIFLMEKGGRLFIGSLIIAMPFIEHEIKIIKTRENEFTYKMSVARFTKVMSRITESLRRSRCRVFLENKSLNIINIDDRTIAKIQLEGILEENQIKLLETFIEKNMLG